MAARTLTAMAREAGQRILDARAEVATLLFSQRTDPPTHDKASHADRALRDAMRAVEDLIERCKVDGDGSQLTMAV